MAGWRRHEKSLETARVDFSINNKARWKDTVLFATGLWLATVSVICYAKRLDHFLLTALTYPQALCYDAESSMPRYK
jgi:hypothetical protein